LKLVFFVNDVATEIDEYTTTRLALAATRMGHEVWYVGAGDVDYSSTDGIGAGARQAVYESTDDLSTFLQRVQEAKPQELVLDDVDAMMLRNDSVEDRLERPWASTAGSLFGQVVADRGVIVVNDPKGLARAASKLYLEEFPIDIRPRSYVGRDIDQIRDFVQQTGATVLKPLYGAKGRNVFIVEDPDDSNLTQMIEAVLEDGYVLAQERVAAAEDGDQRIFLMDGEIMEKDGVYAAFRRIPRGTDERANISTGSKPAPAEIGERELTIAEVMKPQLVDDGMFFVGIDIVGDKVIEINAESPGGFQAVEHFTGLDFGELIVEALEKKSRR
jgi:glutathione synthase